MTQNLRGVFGADQLGRVEARIRDLERQTRTLPSRFGGGGGAAVVTRLKIIGGNPMASGIEAIQYSASVVLPSVYDPDVDTSYVTGVGNAYLYKNGVAQAGAVLVRHNWDGDQSPLRSGRMVGTRGTVTLSYSGTPMTFYLLDWI